MNTIPVVEIFGPTLQGEGPNAGARCIFLRVKGCSFHCAWCDSKYTWNENTSEVINYEPETLSQLLTQKCIDTNCKHIVLTGGNPCLYDFSYILFKLKAFGITVDIETQGDLIPDWLTMIDTIVFSPKAPSSGMPDTYDSIVNFITENNQNNRNIAIKIPVFDDADIDFARKYARFISTFTSKHDNNINLRLYLSVGNSDVNTVESIRDRVLSDYEELLNKINKFPKDFENIYILPQIHTLVWGNKQGV